MYSCDELLVAGHHRASPSATLDKSIQVYSVFCLKLVYYSYR